MKYFLYIILLVLGYVFQCTLIDLFSIKGIVPDLPVIFFIYISFREGRRFGVILGFALGFCLDVLTARLLGTGPLVLSLIGFVSGMAGRKPILHLNFYFFAFSLLLFSYYLLMHFVVYVGHLRFWPLLISETIPSFFYSEFLLLFLLLCVPNFIWQGRKLMVDI